MLTELCQYLHNWFNRKPDGSKYPIYTGTFTISDGVITELSSGELSDGQYFRVMGSLSNEGVHKYGDSENPLTDEVFEGAVWSMAVPPEIVALSSDIDEWNAKYGTIESEAMSPYTSESFRGYSYSKSTTSASGQGASSGWATAFASRLAPWRKI